MDVTESQLAGALERFYVTVESGGGDGRGNLLTVRGPVAEPNETAESLFATLGRMAALREPHLTGLRLTDADLCARCGNQFPDGQLCDPCKRAADADVVDAHICCEHAADAPLAALAAVIREMDGLSLRGEGEQRRVLAYVADLYGFALRD